MGKSQDFIRLEQLLDKISEAAKKSDDVSLDDIMHILGRRSFGPLLLIAGIITLAPLIGDIPGVPTTMGIFVFLIAIQLLFRRRYFWLPEWLNKRSVKPGKINKALEWLYPAARFLDQYLKPRLKIFAEGFAEYIIATVSLTIALVMPVMELIPFSANIAGIALTALGLCLITRDGLMALFSFVVTIAGIVIIFLNFPDLKLFQ